MFYRIKCDEGYFVCYDMVLGPIFKRDVCYAKSWPSSSKAYVMCCRGLLLGLGYNVRVMRVGPRNHIDQIERDEQVSVYAKNFIRSLRASRNKG